MISVGKASDPSKSCCIKAMTSSCAAQGLAWEDMMYPAKRTRTRSSVRCACTRWSKTLGSVSEREYSGECEGTLVCQNWSFAVMSSMG